MKRSLLYTGVAIGVCAVLTSCADAPAPTTGAANAEPSSVAATLTPSETKPTTSASVLAEGLLPNIPITQYELSPARLSLLSVAGFKEAETCLRTFGLTAPQPHGYNGSDDANPLLRRYGVVSMSQATSLGYHLPSDTTKPDGSSTQAQADAASPSADSQAVLLGQVQTYKGVFVPQGGCLGQASTALYGDQSTYNRADALGLVEGIDADSFTASLKQPAVQAVIGSWSSCMASKGLKFSSPISVASSFDLTTANPSATEVRTAQADVTCKRSTGLVTTWSSAETTLQNPQIQKNQAALSQYQKSTTAALSLAQSLTALAIPN